MKFFCLNEKELKKLEEVFSQFIFVGVDPGNTVALAFFDLNFKFLGIWSKRNANLEEIINEIIKKGKPLLFISDVKKVPSLILKLSDKFLVDYWLPNKDLSLDYKRKIVSEFLNQENLKVNLNQHELDALAAVINYLSKNGRKIKYLKEKYKEKAIDLIKYGFIKEVKEKDKGEIKESDVIKEINKNKEKSEIIFKLKKELFNKERFIKKLKVENLKLKEKLKKINDDFNKLLKKREQKIKDKFKNEVFVLNKVIESQEKKIKEFENILKGLESKELVILYDFSLCKANKPTFISNKDLEKVNKEELKKFKYLVKEKDLKQFWKFNKLIVANRKEVENILTPKEDEKKKIVEFFKIYKEQRKTHFLKKSSFLIHFILVILIILTFFIFFIPSYFPFSFKEEIKTQKKEIAYKTLRNSIALLSLYEPVELYLDYPINTTEFSSFYEKAITKKFCENKILKGKIKLYLNKEKDCIEVKN